MDRHPSLSQALNKASDNNLNVALSNISFEYWLILHFEETTRYFLNGAAVCAHLKRHIPDYEKGGDHGKTLIPLTAKALERAKRFARNRPLGNSVMNLNSSTDVHLLVAELQKISVKPYSK